MKIKQNGSESVLKISYAAEFHVNRLTTNFAEIQSDS